MRLGRGDETEPQGRKQKKWGRKTAKTPKVCGKWHIRSQGINVRS